MKFSDEEKDDLICALMYARNAEFNARLYAFSDAGKKWHDDHAKRLQKLIDKVDGSNSF